MSIKPVSLFACLCLLAAAGAPVSAAGDEGVSNFEVSLLVDGKKQSDTWINLSQGGTLIEIPAAPVLSALEPLVSKDVIQNLARQVNSQGTFTNKVLARFGVSISINGPRKQVYLAIPKASAKAKRTADPDSLAPGLAGAGSSGDSVPRPRVKAMDSGPWASSPTPALPGHQSDSLDTAFALNGKPGKPGKPGLRGAAGSPGAGAAPMRPSPSDADWAPAGTASDPAGPAGAANGEPTVELQTYRLDKTREELFEDVFKHKPPTLPPSVEVTLLVDGKSYGTLWINYSKEQKLYTFPADPVLNALQGLVKRELWEKLSRKAKTQSRFTVEDLIECGFPTVLNTSVFELSTGVPAQLVGTKIHPLSGQVIDPYSVPAYEPSFLSAFMNMRLKERIPYYQYNPTPFDSMGFGKRQVEARNQETRQPTTTNLDGAVNLGGWVLEGKGIVWEKRTLNEFEFSRQDARLVHDWPRKALRLTAGDLIFPTNGFQSFLNMGGVGLSRDFSLQPHLAAYPVKEFEFFLTNPSEVKVFINGNLRGTLQLDQGTHDLQGFPFTMGESEVEIQITDNTGQMQTLNFSFIHEPSLLARGKSAFSYNVGFPRRDTWQTIGLPPQPDGFKLMNYEYDLGHPLVFLDYRRGITDNLSLEAYSQAVDTAGMAGVDAFRAMRLGKVKADLAASYHLEADMGWAGSLEYTYIPRITSDMSPTSWRLRSEYLSAGFFRPGQDPGLLGSLTLGGSYQRQGKLANFSLGSSYTFREDSVDFYSVTLGLGKTFGKGWSSNFSLRNTYDRQRHTNTLVAANLSYFFFQGENAVAASARIENHVPDGFETGTPPNWDVSNDLAWDYNGSAPFPHNPTLGATASFGPRSNDYAAKAAWKGDQGAAEIYGRRFEAKTSSIIINYADLALQTSLVYVDGNVALSRPITNSFLLVKGIENEKRCAILVNPNEVGYDAKSKEWLPGVVPNISPYALKKIHLDVQDPPFGTNDERTDFTIFPGYKSGYALYMGSEATVIALGTLLLSPGVPVEYQTFTATPMDGKTRDPIMGFTNGAGKFQLTRMKPGRYKLEAELDGTPYSLVMTLPKNAEGIRSIGTLVFKPK